MKLGLVTVLYKSDDVLEGFFESVARQDYTNSILYIIDNSPNDITDNIIQTLTLKNSITNYIHLKSKGNIGIADGNNAGIEKALNDGCTYVILLNNDIEFESNNVFSKMIETSKLEKAELVVPKILFYDTRKIWLGGCKFDKLKCLGQHEGLFLNENECSVSKRIDSAPTCFMLIHKSVFEKIGLVDGKYFAYYDDTDFVYRAIANKFILWYEHSIVILHKVSSSTGGDFSNFYIYHSNRNKIYFIRKHYDFISRFITYSHVFLTRFIYVFTKYTWPQSKQVFKGIFDGFKMKVEG